MTKRKRIGIGYSVVEILCQIGLLAGLVSGILFFGAEELELTFSEAPVIWTMIVAAILAVVLCRMSMPTYLIAISGIAGTGVAFYFLWEPISLGARVAATQWVELFNDYFHQWKSGPEMPELARLSSGAREALLSESSQIFLMYLAAILLFWSAFFLIRMGSLAVLHTLLGLELFFILTVGVVPKGYSLLWYIALTLLWSSGGGSRGLRQKGAFGRWHWGKASFAAAAFSAAAMGIALWICIGALLPKAEPFLAEGGSGMKTWIRARLEEAADWDALFGNSARSGGVNGGDLSRQGDRMESGSVALSVTVNQLPSESLYLKAYVGSEYEGDSWESLPAGLLERESGLLAEHVWEFPVDFLARAGAAFSDITVELHDAANQYLYVPYGAAIPEDSRFVSDQYLRRWSSEREHYSYSSDFYFLADTAPRERKEERIYAEYVREHYLETPNAEVWEQWKASKKEGASLSALIGEIQDYLADQADYTLSPGPLPEGEDFIEYFLFQNRKGYCTHFASAATILFRLWDIPARYVEGYVVSPEEFRDNGDGTWTAWVTDGSAHAWTEIYREGVTWYPVETTPPYWNEGNLFPVGQEPDETEVPLESESEEAESPAESQPESPMETGNEAEMETSSLSQEETKPVSEEAKQEPTFHPIFWYIFGIVLVVLLTAGVIVGKKAFERKRRWKRIQDPNRRLAVLALGEEAERLLFGTAEQSVVLKADFGQKAAEQIIEIDRKTWENFAQLVKKVRFSPHPVSEEEYLAVLAVYQKARECRKKRI
ncbi:transglutaminaseTgpA domain-containing protein [Hominifimenecus sp. rT4P-3]|uniref:transglutaminase family protein n=1 Tax=Hominifimenecus sp. rT4P-3 TaxID=3242979 RepID=UPI003DA5CDC1